MANSDDVIVVNEGYEIRNGRVVITVRAEPIITNFNPKAFGRGPANAIAFHLKEKMRGISERAPDATLEYRKRAAKAFERGAEWAIKRYAGGRMGAKAPNQSDRAFNDSERMEESIRAGYSEGDATWRINVAANRSRDDNTGGFARIWEKLTRLVPEFADAALLLGQDLVRAAIEKSQRDAITKMDATTRNTSVELAMAVTELAEAAAEVAEPALEDAG